MEYITLNLLLIFFCVIGFIVCIKHIINCIFIPFSLKNYYVIFPVSGEVEDMEFILRSHIQSLKWNSRYKPHKLICLDLEMGQNTRKICEKFKDDYSFIEIVEKDSLKDYLTVMEKDV